MELCIYKSNNILNAYKINNILRQSPNVKTFKDDIYNWRVYEDVLNKLCKYIDIFSRCIVNMNYTIHEYILLSDRLYDLSIIMFNLRFKIIENVLYKNKYCRIENNYKNKINIYMEKIHNVLALIQNDLMYEHRYKDIIFKVPIIW